MDDTWIMRGLRNDDYTPPSWDEMWIMRRLSTVNNPIINDDNRIIIMLYSNLILFAEDLLTYL